MSSLAKFVRMELEGGGNSHHFIFPAHMDHSMMVKMVQSEWPGMKPVTAGFVSIGLDTDCVNVFGASLTLKLKPDAEDEGGIKILLRER